jgi:hypothetical protein
VYGIDLGSTVITLTSGAGRGGGGDSLLHPLARTIAIATSTARDTRGNGMAGPIRKNKDCRERAR